MIITSFNKKILLLSDLALGYGTPQISYLLKSISSQYPGSHITVVEPDQKGRPWAEGNFPFEIARVSTAYPAYSHAFTIEYNRFIYAMLKRESPDIVIACHGMVLPACLRYRANTDVLLIYYMLESINHQSAALGAPTINMNRCAIDMADVVLVPEIDRARADLNHHGWHRGDILEIYNCGQPYSGGPVQNRNGRVLYAGSIGPQTLCEIMLSPELSHIHFDVAGSAETEAGRQFISQAASHANINYLGLLSSPQLESVRRNYAYSLVFWKPDDINQLYASPNKLFETIAAGVPPIAAPHPQCYSLIKRYGCGLLSADWSAGGLIQAILDGMSLYENDSANYSDLVQGCVEAVQSELNWNQQFEKIVAFLEKRSTSDARSHSMARI
ncbi:MAG TPA: hypothetical protein V6C97_32700 [Oculatellaceae cyanobacterium]